MMLETILSFDNSVVMPIRASNQDEIPTIVDGSRAVLPFMIIAEDEQEGNPFVNLPVHWRVTKSRTAFRFALCYF